LRTDLATRRPQERELPARAQGVQKGGNMFFPKGVESKFQKKSLKKNRRLKDVPGVVGNLGTKKGELSDGGVKKKNPWEGGRNDLLAKFLFFEKCPPEWLEGRRQRTGVSKKAKRGPWEGPNINGGGSPATSRPQVRRECEIKNMSPTEKRSGTHLRRCSVGDNSRFAPLLTYRRA